MLDAASWGMLVMATQQARDRQQALSSVLESISKLASVEDPAIDLRSFASDHGEARSCTQGTLQMNSVMDVST